MIVGLLFGSIFLTACLMPAQADSYWHLRAGQELWLTHHVTLVEHWSHTARGRFWPNHEWLWQALSYGLYHLGGMPLLVTGGAAIVTAGVVLSWRLMVGSVPTRLVLILLGTPISACVWALRPQIVSLALLATLVTVLARERYRLLPALFVLWANVHGAVAMGGTVLGATAVLAAFKARSGVPSDRRRAFTLLALTPICAAATALTPMGPRLWTFIGESIQRSRQTMINEWMPTYPKGPVEIAFWVLAIAFIILLVRRWRTLRDWSDWAVVVAAVVILPLAFRAVRNIPPFLLLAAPAASRLCGPDFRLRRASGEAASSPDHRGLNLAILIGFLAACTIGVAFAWTKRLAMLGWDPLGAGTIAALRACPGPLYNRYGDGGYVIWFAPETPVFVDSRQDPYPVDFVIDAVRNDVHATYRDLFARYGIRCALLPHDSATLPRLRADGWRALHADESWAVLAPASLSGPTAPLREPPRH